MEAEIGDHFQGQCRSLILSHDEESGEMKPVEAIVWSKKEVSHSQFLARTVSVQG